MTADTSTVVGRNPVRELLERADVGIEKVMLEHDAHGSTIRAIREAAQARGIPLQYVPEARLRHEAQGAVHQGVAAITAPMRYDTPHDLLTAVAPTWDDVQTRKPVLLAIDRVTDPRNFGAILRSAVASGANGVVVPSRGMAPLNATAIKASAGTAPRLSIARTDDLAAFLTQCKERGYWVVGAEGTSDTSLWAVDWERPVVIVVGSEGDGLASDVAAACDTLAAIPMRGPAESLNVSVAASLFLFAAARGRS
ncbi:23S rRNA (guanosine(2251)-2'-O)-methyltransferase RlmB [Salisaeta longa]|uniref:23S rRNA (guanosine(2251)-2'-O)-methyltransferase RlmB n=1 Tax=Salisaeta longa TaxID=503170 RepID=UPI0003B52A0F|nr:23S rRNA (guanosine(2251)-2'-O)-methyltransferase RlmB [Salisaeta longa]